MQTGNRHIMSAATEAAVKAVRRRCGSAVSVMPPVLISFLFNCYNGGGWPIYHSGDTWEMVTGLQHIRIDVQGPHRARLKTWGKRVDRSQDPPAVDRIIECQKG